MSKCLNCGSEFSDNFCGHCGQEKIVQRIRFKNLIAQFLKFILLIESHILITIKNLAVRPGHFVRDYLAGKRVPYCSPIQFFLLFMTIYLIFFGLFGDRFLHFVNTSVNADVAQQEMMKVQKLQYFVKSHLNIFYFIWPVLMALFSKILFHKRDVYYAEFLVLYFYVFGMDFIFSLPVILLTAFDPRIHLLRNIFVLVYFPFAIGQFLKSKRIWTFFKIYISIILSYIAYVFVILIIAIISFTMA